MSRDTAFDCDTGSQKFCFGMRMTLGAKSEFLQKSKTFRQTAALMELLVAKFIFGTGIAKVRQVDSPI